jgi:hypothetical protein
MGIDFKQYEEDTRNVRFLPSYLKEDAIGNSIWPKKCHLIKWELRFNATKEERVNSFAIGKDRFKECSQTLGKVREYHLIQPWNNKSRVKTDQI